MQEDEVTILSGLIERQRPTPAAWSADTKNPKYGLTHWAINQKIESRKRSQISGFTPPLDSSLGFSSAPLAALPLARQCRLIISSGWAIKIAPKAGIIVWRTS